MITGKLAGFAASPPSTPRFTPLSARSDCRSARASQSMGRRAEVGRGSAGRGGKGSRLAEKSGRSGGVTKVGAWTGLRWRGPARPGDKTALRVPDMRSANCNGARPAAEAKLPYNRTSPELEKPASGVSRGRSNRHMIFSNSGS